MGVFDNRKNKRFSGIEKNLLSGIKQGLENQDIKLNKKIINNNEFLIFNRDIVNYYYKNSLVFSKMKTGGRNTFFNCPDDYNITLLKRLKILKILIVLYSFIDAVSVKNHRLYLNYLYQGKKTKRLVIFNKMYVLSNQWDNSKTIFC